eukprot:SAG31_NODE_1521_length_8022_cov_17.832261_1_plen_240_part_00
MACCGARVQRARDHDTTSWTNRRTGYTSARGVQRLRRLPASGDRKPAYGPDNSMGIQTAPTSACSSRRRLKNGHGRSLPRRTLAALQYSLACGKRTPGGRKPAGTLQRAHQRMSGTAGDPLMSYHHHPALENVVARLKLPQRGAWLVNPIKLWTRTGPITLRAHLHQHPHQPITVTPRWKRPVAWWPRSETAYSIDSWIYSSLILRVTARHHSLAPTRRHVADVAGDVAGDGMQRSRRG